MATFEEHAAAIKIAIEAAQVAGFRLEADLSYDYDGTVDEVELDLWDGSKWINVYTEERD